MKFFDAIDLQVGALTTLNPPKTLNLKPHPLDSFPCHSMTLIILYHEASVLHSNLISCSAVLCACMAKAYFRRNAIALQVCMQLICTAQM